MTITETTTALVGGWTRVADTAGGGALAHALNPNALASATIRQALTKILLP